MYNVLWEFEHISQATDHIMFLIHIRGYLYNRKLKSSTSYFRILIEEYAQSVETSSGKLYRQLMKLPVTKELLILIGRFV